MASPGSNERATETQAEGEEIPWQVIIEIIGYVPNKVTPGTKLNIKDAEVNRTMKEVFTNPYLSVNRKHCFAMRILDRRASHSYLAFSYMLRLVGHTEITAKQEEALVSKMFSIKGRNELLVDVLTDLEKRPSFNSTKLRNLFAEDNHTHTLAAEPIVDTLRNIPVLAAREISASVKTFPTLELAV